MLAEHKAIFRICRDEIGDSIVACRPATNPGVISDDGDHNFLVHVETRRPIVTANTIVAMLAREGIKSIRSQTGDSEVIVKIFHGGNHEVEAKILGLLSAHRRRKLSPEEKTRLAEASKPFRFQSKHGAGARLRLQGSTISSNSIQNTLRTSKPKKRPSKEKRELAR